MDLGLLIHLLELIHISLNIVSDSAYIVRLFLDIETAIISSSHSDMFPLLQGLQYPVRVFTHSLFITHTRAYSNLPGFISEGNKIADASTYPIFTSPEQEYPHLHINSSRLHVQYHILLRQMTQIMQERFFVLSYTVIIL